MRRRLLLQSTCAALIRLTSTDRSSSIFFRSFRFAVTSLRTSPKAFLNTRVLLQTRITAIPLETGERNEPNHAEAKAQEDQSRKTSG